MVCGLTIFDFTFRNKIAFVFKDSGQNYTAYATLSLPYLGNLLALHNSTSFSCIQVVLFYSSDYNITLFLVLLTHCFIAFVLRHLCSLVLI